MPEMMTIAYLTSAYARASDSFIRGEVAQLRALGFIVHTFSIRRPLASELVSEEIRREHAATEFVHEAGAIRLVLAWLRAFTRSPRRALAAVRLAIRTGTPGLKGRLWPLAYLLEAAYLADRLRAEGVEHLHNHIGEGSASVAMLASALSGIPFSITIHGPGEFDRPTLLALEEKIRRASFTVAVSDFGRSQLYRWSDPADWSRIHVVHCGLDGTFLDADPRAIPDERRLICVGRLAEQKGTLLLIEAAGRLAGEGLAFELVLIGDGPLRRPIERLIERLGLRDQVRLAGWQGAEAVREEILRRARWCCRASPRACRSSSWRPWPWAAPSSALSWPVSPSWSCPTSAGGSSPRDRSMAWPRRCARPSRRRPTTWSGWAARAPPAWPFGTTAHSRRPSSPC